MLVTLAGVLIGLAILVMLVVVHELGHALVAKHHGVVVEEFGIGFPPRAKKWQPAQSFLGKKVIFSLNWLPLGGFVRLKGEYDAARGQGSYGSASFWVKTKILLAGVAMNWLTAVVLFTVLALVGMPKLLPHQVTLPFDTVVSRAPLTVMQLQADSPAAKSGLKKGDQLISINHTPVTTANDLRQLTERLKGQTVTVRYSRQGSQQQITTTLNTPQQAQRQGYLGVVSGQPETIRSTWSAPLAGVATTGQLTYETVKGLGDTLSKTWTGLVGQFAGSPAATQAARADLASASKNVAGPIQILGVLFPSVIDAGWTQVVLLAAIISLTLAVMNILPIPALDGGRWFTMAGFRLFRKELTQRREEIVQTVGLLLLLLLTLVVTYNDIKKFF